MRAFNKTTIVLALAFLLVGCKTTPERVFGPPNSGLEQFTTKTGVRVALPEEEDWTIEDNPSDIVWGFTRFRCEVNISSPKVSFWVSPTKLSICTRVVWDGGRFRWSDKESDFDKFVAVASKYYSHTKYLRIEHGELKPFSYTDTLGRKWAGLCLTDILYGTVQGEPSVEEATRIFLRLTESWVMEIAFRGLIKVGNHPPKTRGSSLPDRLSVLDTISFVP